MARVRLGICRGSLHEIWYFLLNASPGEKDKWDSISSPHLKIRDMEIIL